MKKILALIAIITISSVAIAQQKFISAGIKAGMNISSANEFFAQFQNGKMSSKAGFVGGLFLEVRPLNNLSVSGEVLYSNQGFTAESTTNSVTSKTEVKLNYINIPVLVNFYLIDGLAVKTGVQYGIKTSEKIESSISGLNNAFKGADLSIPLGLSYNFNCGLIIDARYNFGVNDISVGSVGGIILGKTKSNVFAVTLGYRF